MEKPKRLYTMREVHIARYSSQVIQFFVAILMIALGGNPMPVLVGMMLGGLFLTFYVIIKD